MKTRNTRRKQIRRYERHLLNMRVKNLNTILCPPVLLRDYNRQAYKATRRRYRQEIQDAIKRHVEASLLRALQNTERLVITDDEVEARYQELRAEWGHRDTTKHPSS